MRIYATAPLFLLSVCATCGCGQADRNDSGQRDATAADNISEPHPSVNIPANGAALPEWWSDENHLSRLADEVAFPERPEYRYRVPKGLRLTRRVGPGGAPVAAYLGEKRQDGSIPLMDVMIVTPPPGQETRKSLEEAAQIMLSPYRNSMQHWVQGPFERGTIGGLTFVRVNWSGMNPRARKPGKLHGVFYVALDGPTIIQLQSNDAGSNEEWLSLVRSSIHSFRKVPQSPPFQ